MYLMVRSNYLFTGVADSSITPSKSDGEIAKLGKAIALTTPQGANPGYVYEERACAKRHPPQASINKEEELPGALQIGLENQRRLIDTALCPRSIGVRHLQNCGG